VQNMTSTSQMWAKRALGEERRKHRRAPYDAAVSAEPIPPLGLSRFPMLAEDISEGGLRVCCTDFVPRQSRMLVTLYRSEPKEVIRVAGTVVRVQRVDRQGRWTLGLAFDELSAGARAQVRELVTGRTPETASLDIRSS